MIGFSRREKIVFRYSLFFHFFGASVLFSLGFLPSCEEEPEEIHVFELAMSSDQPIVSQASELPTLPPPPPIEPTPKPRPKPPVIEPVIKPKPILNTEPVSPAVQPKPRSKPKPISKPIEKPKAISFDEFRRQNKLPNVQSGPKIPKTVPLVKIDSSRMKPLEIKVSPNKGTSLKSLPVSVLNSYLSSVKLKLEKAWQSKLRSSSIASGGEVWLSFKISPNGFLVNQIISKSSGNRELDNLVLQAANLVGNVGIPPGGVLDSSLKVPFRLN